MAEMSRCEHCGNYILNSVLMVTRGSDILGDTQM